MLAALAAGLISFLSPRVLPSSLGYLSAISGVRPTELEAAAIGELPRDHRDTLETISGVLLVAIGVLILTGEFFQLSIEAQKLTRELGLDT